MNYSCEKSNRKLKYDNIISLHDNVVVINDRHHMKKLKNMNDDDDDDDDCNSNKNDNTNTDNDYSNKKSFSQETKRYKRSHTLNLNDQHKFKKNIDDNNNNNNFIGDNKLKRSNAATGIATSNTIKMKDKSSSAARSNHNYQNNPINHDNNNKNNNIMKTPAKNYSYSSTAMIAPIGYNDNYDNDNADMRLMNSVITSSSSSSSSMTIDGTTYDDNDDDDDDDDPSNEEIFELMKLTLINNDDSDFKFFTCLLMDRITQNKIKL